MVRFSIVPERTALLVIDMQNAFLKPGSAFEVPRGREFIPRLNRLIEACRKKRIRVIFTRHAHSEDGSDLGLFREFVPTENGRPFIVDGTLDSDISPEVGVRKDDIVITKQIYSAFCGTNLEHILRGNGIDTVIISGVVTALCCEATARDARHKNLKVIFLSDVTASYEYLPDMGWGVVSADEVQRVVLTILALRYAEVASAEDILKRVEGLGK